MIKSLIVGIVCLFVFVGPGCRYIGPPYIGPGSAYAGYFSDVAEESAERTNKELEDEIRDVLNMDEIRWLLQSQRDLNQLERMRDLRESVRRKAAIQRRSDNTIKVFGSIFKLGIAYWGFSQHNSYGNVTGVLFALGGTVQLLSLEF